MIYSNISRTLLFTRLFPPVGSAIGSPQTRHFISVEHFPNIFCSFLHLLHLILMNFDFVSLIFFILYELYFFCSESFLLGVFFLAFLTFKTQVCFFACFSSSHSPFANCWFAVFSFVSSRVSSSCFDSFLTSST